ncbi:MAG TPA: hypothetical protein VGD40_07445 [Chryseosolibacter sp.]
MRHIDFYIQTGLLVLSSILFLLLSGYGLMIGQFFVGLWQIFSCVVSVLTVRAFRKQKLWHLALSVLLLGVIYLLNNGPLFANDMITLVAFFAPCWALAIYYYMITWMWSNKDSQRSKFLPNISF